MWWWVLGQLPFLPFDLGLVSLKVSSERKVYVCNHALYYFKFHGIVPQQVSITSTFDPHVGTLVIVFGLSHKVFFHNHRFASDCQELLPCCRCQLLVMFVFNVHYCYCYQYHTPNGVQHHCHDRHCHSCHFHSCRSSDPHFPPSYLLKHHLHMATATFMLMAQSFASSSDKTAFVSTLQCCAYHVDCWTTSSQWVIECKEKDMWDSG